jgi:zinc transporter ZupT
VSSAFWGVGITGLGSMAGAIAGAWIAQPPTSLQKEFTTTAPILFGVFSGAFIGAVIGFCLIVCKAREQKQNASSS